MYFNQVTCSIMYQWEWHFEALDLHSHSTLWKSNMASWKISTFVRNVSTHSFVHGRSCSSYYISLLLHYELFLHTWPLQRHHPSSIPPHWPNHPPKKPTSRPRNGTCVRSHNTHEHRRDKIQDFRNRASRLGCNLGHTHEVLMSWSIQSSNQHLSVAFSGVCSNLCFLNAVSSTTNCLKEKIFLWIFSQVLGWILNCLEGSFSTPPEVLNLNDRHLLPQD